MCQQISNYTIVFFFHNLIDLQFSIIFQYVICFLPADFAARRMAKRPVAAARTQQLASRDTGIAPGPARGAADRRLAGPAAARRSAPGPALKLTRENR